MIKKPKREIDLPILVIQLKEELNLTWEDLSILTGYSTSYLTKLSTEAVEGKSIKKAINLLMLFLANTETDIPIIGRR